MADIDYAIGAAFSAIMDRLDAQQDILKAILKALNTEPPPSPVVAAMQEVAATLREQTGLLQELGRHREAEEMGS